jgi:2,4-dienoyl-CoA reductase-like NADH-dependent reductase (Old Yellow Enzyme family)
MNVFEKASIGELKLKNRIIRSATFEGMCDCDGIPGEAYYSMYEELAKNELGVIITGFSSVSAEGKAIHAGQAMLDRPEKIPYFKTLTEKVHRHDCSLILQLAHTGRQTRSSYTGKKVVGCSARKSKYFKEKPKILSKTEIQEIIEKFVRSAEYAKTSNFDGVQLHAGHGYLIHQFLMPTVNDRKDEFGINKASNIGSEFLKKIIDGIRNTCGQKFPVLVKISACVDPPDVFTLSHFVELIRFLNETGVSGIEISYGTMDNALNIIRGDLPVIPVLNHNPIYGAKNRIKRAITRSVILPYIKSTLKPFSPMYNLDYAALAKRLTDIPIITVGGFRSYNEMNYAITNGKTDFISMCRPLICEPDFIGKVMKDYSYQSKCKNCNYCAIMCDSKNITKCYKKK